MAFIIALDSPLPRDGLGADSEGNDVVFGPSCPSPELFTGSLLRTLTQLTK